MQKKFPATLFVVSLGLAPFLGCLGCSSTPMRGATTGTGGVAGSSSAGSSGSAGSVGSAGSSAGSSGEAGSSLGGAGSSGEAGSSLGGAGSGGSVDSGAGDGSSASPDGGASCATAGYKLCDDFEGAAPGAATSDWTIIKNGYTMTVDTTQSHSGTHSMHANFGGGGGYAYIMETKTFPATDWWGRAWMRFMAPKGGHQVFAGSDTNIMEPQGNQMRYLNDTGGGTFVMNMREGDNTVDSHVAIPVGTWNCYEWHQTPTAVDLFIDGKMAGTATGQPFKGLSETYVSMVLGAERFGGGAAGDVWIDDVAVNSTQIGCN